MKTRHGIMVLGFVLAALSGIVSRADLAIQSLDSTGRLTFSTLNDGTNYNYQVEWAPSPSGPWSPFTGMGAWIDNFTAAQGTSITSMVPMCFRVVATLGDYLVVDLSGGTNATTYPVSYYRSLADLPGGVGVNSDIYKTTNMVFRRIPAGTFMMGSPTNELGRLSNEARHQVTLTRSFYIGVFEVTQKQWAQVMGTWPTWFTNANCRDSRPVAQVSYNDIRGASYGAGWPMSNNVDASSFMGRLRVCTGAGFDLPTEAQWEYACRSGTMTALNSGNNLVATDDCSNLSDIGRYLCNGGSNYVSRNVDTSGATAKVGSYRPNAWGLYDMHGNVWEWCLDWYEATPGPASDPQGPPSGSGRVVRCGGYDDYAYRCRAALRSHNDPSFPIIDVGFRAALTP